MTIHCGGEGQRVGCRACDVVFMTGPPGTLRSCPVPCATSRVR